MSPLSQKQIDLFLKWSSAFDSARHRLLAIRRQEGTEEVYRKGIIIDREVSFRDYLRFCEENPRISVKHRLIDGKIEAYEMPLEPHARIQGELIHITRSWSEDHLYVFGELDVIVNTREIIRPDLCVRPSNRQQPQSPQVANSSGRPYPTLVVEIGNSESLNSVHETAAKYFSQRTSIQIYLAIKLFPPRGRQNDTFALLALIYLRSNQNPTIPVVAISFGTADPHISSQRYLQNLQVGATGVGFGGVPCDHANIPEYQMAIPTRWLFDDVPGGVPNDVPVNFTIDLWKLQCAFRQAN